jgi:hypothetical protein
MVAKQKIVAAINEQIGNEFSAMLQYYAIAAHFGAEALPEHSAANAINSKAIPAVPSFFERVCQSFRQDFSQGI